MRNSIALFDRTTGRPVGLLTGELLVPDGLLEFVPNFVPTSREPARVREVAHGAKRLRDAVATGYGYGE
jgi:hypothetical protein